MGGANLQLRLHAGPQIALIRDLNGRFNAIKGPMNAAANDMAYRVALEMHDYLEETIKRRPRFDIGDRSPFPGRKTKYLRRALVDQRNWRVRSTGSQFEVGLRDWLDKSPAGKYWENLDKGTAAHVGHVIRFFDYRIGPRGTKVLRMREGQRPVVMGGTMFARVNRPIRAVNYLRIGARRGQRVIEGGFAQEMYEKYLPDYPIRFAARLGRAPGGGFTAP